MPRLCTIPFTLASSEGLPSTPCKMAILEPGGRCAAIQVPASLPPARLSVATTEDLPVQSGMSLSISTTLMPLSTAFCSSPLTFGLVGVMAIAVTPWLTMDWMALISLSSSVPLLPWA